MNFNNFLFNPNRLDKKRDVLFSCKHIALMLALTLSVGSVSTAKSQNLMSDKIDDSSNKKKSYSSSLIVARLAMDSSIAIYNYLESLKPENLDFSDFPYSDGSVESKLEIAKYVRELVKNIPTVYKYNYVLDHFKFTKEEYMEFYTVIHLEGKPGNEAYELAFADATNVFNRVISSYKSKMIGKKFDTEGPISLYQHITASGQYSPYGSKEFNDFLGTIDEETFLGCLDALFVMDYIPERMHDYLDFRATKYMDDCVQLVKGGNWFRNSLQEDDIIPLEERYYYQEEKTLDESVLRKILK